MSKTRFFSGFQEFKLQLLAEWHEKQRLDALLSKEPISSHTNFEDLLDILPQIYDKALTNTRFTLRKQQLPKLINFIEKSDQIIFLGTGIQYISAQAAAFKFSNLGGHNNRYGPLLISIFLHSIKIRKQYFSLSALLEKTSPFFRWHVI